MKPFVNASPSPEPQPPKTGRPIGSGPPSRAGQKTVPSRNRLRVLLAEDHTLVRAGIRSLLERLPGVQVVAEAAEGREVLGLAKIRRPDVVLMDIGMPGLNGLEAAVRLRKKQPAVRVVMLSMHANEEYVVQALKAGAVGYLLKKSAVVELEAALRTVARGGRYVCSEIARQVGPHTLAGANSPHGRLETLTPRQREVLQLIAESKNTKETAQILGLSPKTVEFHRAEMMRRLDIYDVPGLVRFAMQSGIAAHEA